MVLSELGSKITNALRNMSNSTVIDKEVLDSMLKEICNALVTADVNFNLVIKLRKNITEKVKIEDMAAGLNKRKIIQQVHPPPKKNRVSTNRDFKRRFSRVMMRGEGCV